MGRRENLQDYTLPDYEFSSLVVIDVQNDFTLPDGAAEIKGTMDKVPRMAELLNAYRHHSLPVIHVVRLYLPDGSNAELCRRQSIENGTRLVCPGSEGAEIVSMLKPAPDFSLDHSMLLRDGLQIAGEKEWILFKSRWGAFFKTPLDAHLRQLNVNTLVICGCNYPNCVRATIYEASARDYRLVLAKDAVSGLDDRGIKEMRNIGVSVKNVQSIRSAL